MSLGTINFPPTIRGLGPRASVGHGPLQSPWTREFSVIVGPERIKVIYYGVLTTVRVIRAGLL